jgi:hypothetical protein
VFALGIVLLVQGVAGLGADASRRAASAIIIGIVLCYWAATGRIPGVVSSLKTHQSTPISEGGLHRARRMPATTREADRLNFALQRFPALPSDTTQRRQCIDKLFATHPQ